MAQFNAKRIADPVHGTIGLSALEARVISTRAFQRLRNVKQLGLAHYVFPGADYSRFSHSIGVCHVTGRILDALSQLGIPDLDARTIQLYRLAALLHDVGHYPFSHAMEDALHNHFSQQFLAPLAAANAPAEVITLPQSTESLPSYYPHETLGKQVLLKDEEMNALLREAGYDPEDIAGIFTRAKPMRFANLVSSDLDADRIDYLLRTAHHTGLPYGAVDLDYLLSQMRVDDQSRVCLTDRALKTADHFLLCRYFDYQQVAFHKTVAGLEGVLKDVLTAMIEAAFIDGSAEDVMASLQEGRWAEFDDALVIQKMRVFAQAKETPSTQRLKANAILNRTPPKLLVDYEVIRPRTEAEKRRFRGVKQAVQEKLKQWAAEFALDLSLWYVWEKSGLALTKVGSHVSQSAFYEGKAGERDDYEQEIRVLDAAGVSSKSIVEIPHSLMSVLSDQALYSLRIYVLLPLEKIQVRDELAAKIKSDLPHMEWK